MEKGIVLPSFYLAPIAYYSHILQTDGEILLERHEHFPKQTYRNRASIHSPNGRLDLTIPIQKTEGQKRTQMKDVRISNADDWQRQHWMTLQTSYRRSAYFEYYEDDFLRYYNRKFNFLFDFNHEFNEMILSLLKIKMDFSFTEVYRKSYPDLLDLREVIHPKKNLPLNKAYFQVFEPKNSFIPNLSIVDLLFNQGPQSKNYL
jgi:hypothetical protein